MASTWAVVEETRAAATECCLLREAADKVPTTPHSTATTTRAMSSMATTASASVKPSSSAPTEATPLLSAESGDATTVCILRRRKQDSTVEPQKGSFGPRSVRPASPREDEEEACFAGDLPSDARLSTTGAAVGGEPLQPDGQLEGVARHDLAPEACPVDAAEERQPAGEALVGEHGRRPELGERLDHEHPGQGWPPREVAGEERLLPAEAPEPGGHLAGLE